MMASIHAALIRTKESANSLSQLGQNTIIYCIPVIIDTLTSSIVLTSIVL